MYKIFFLYTTSLTSLSVLKLNNISSLPVNKEEGEKEKDKKDEKDETIIPVAQPTSPSVDDNSLLKKILIMQNQFNKKNYIFNILITLLTIIPIIIFSFILIKLYLLNKHQLLIKNQIIENNKEKESYEVISRFPLNTVNVEGIKNFFHTNLQYLNNEKNQNNNTEYKLLYTAESESRFEHLKEMFDSLKINNNTEEMFKHTSVNVINLNNENFIKSFFNRNGKEEPNTGFWSFFSNKNEKAFHDWTSLLKKINEEPRIKKIILEFVNGDNVEKFTTWIKQKQETDKIFLNYEVECNVINNSIIFTCTDKNTSLIQP